MKSLFSLLILFSVPCFLLSQSQRSWSPKFVEGQAWPEESAPFTRLPNSAEKNVTKNVWNLSRNSTGLFIRFVTNAPRVTVRYTVQGGHAFPHMPATGVSGVDLYGTDRDGKWIWFPGRYSFQDTISYTFGKLLTSGDTSGRNYEYRLYLPLYNTVTWLELNYPDSSSLEQLPSRSEKPIVVYGTSIAQGGCASRPGLAWTSILERNLDRPLINLGFSGNGQLDTAVIDLIAGIDAKLFALDCLPNLTDSRSFSDEEITKRLFNAVRTIRARHSATPILFSDHSAGGENDGINLPDNAYQRINKVMKLAFDRMKKEGFRDIYLLENKAINFNMNSTVDGVHPNDIGMEQNAAAYEKLIREILKEPAGKISTTIPVQQSRDYFYFMPRRHHEVLEYNKKHNPETAFIGNSIVHMWGGAPGSSITNGTASWNEVFGPLNTVNMGFGWDRIENVLWRVYHDELEGFNAKRIIVMIGTNNIGLNTDEEILEGLENLYRAILVRQPNAKLYVIGILPRRSTEKRISSINTRIAQIAKRIKAAYADPGKVLLNKNGTIEESFFTDGLHPGESGYQKLAEQFKTIIK